MKFTIFICLSFFVAMVNAEQPSENNKAPSSSGFEKQNKAPNIQRETSYKEFPSEPKVSKTTGAGPKNVKGRDGKVPTESSKNSHPSELKTQERTKSVE